MKNDAKNIRKIVLFIFFFLTTFFVVVYSFLFVIPSVVINSELSKERLGNYISQKTGADIDIKNPQIFVSPQLVYKFNVEKLDVKDKNHSQIIFIQDMRVVVDLKSLKLNDLYADYIFLDGDILRHFFPINNKSSSYRFDVSQIQKVFIRNFVYKSVDFVLNMKDISYSDKKLMLDAHIESRFLDNDIFIRGASFFVRGNNLYADEVVVNFGRAKVIISGDILGDKNFFVKGNNLPVGDIEKSLLFYQKQQDPAKKFLENFKNYRGYADIDLRVNKDGFFGNCFVKNLYADMVWFDIPVKFKEVLFVFEKERVTSYARGNLGKEPVTHKLEIVNLGTPQKEVRGSVKTVLTKNFGYIDGLRILKSADLQVDYFIKSQKSEVKYYLNFDNDSDLFYKSMYLGLRDKKRKFYFETLKDGDNLVVKNYKYSILENNIYNPIIFGDGLFIRQNNKLVPAYFNCRTNAYAPVSTIGVLRRYVAGGNFRGNLKVDLLGDRIVGDFELQDTHFKNFYIKSAKVIAQERVKISADGCLYGQKFNCNLEAKNQFNTNDIHVYNLDLFLDKFIVKHKHKTSRKHNKNMKNMRRKFYSRTRDYDVEIDNWKIRLNEIRSGRIVAENIFLYGKLQNKIFDFTIDNLSFARGYLLARGQYHFEDDSSSVVFIAKNIDSNIAADMIFGLHNQIEGVANATLHLYTKDYIDDIQAVVKFSVDNGFLPKLGSTEFMLKNNKKIRLMDIIEVDSDLRKKKALASDIRGFFKVDNTILKDIHLTSQQKFLSLFIEGEYEIKKQYADLNLYGKYNKEVPKGIRVVFIPLNWILNILLKPEESKDFYAPKLNQIPSINAPKENEKYFRVRMQGNLNQDSIDVEMKSIR